MKANQKFLNGEDDEAVSPVIAVILMVAITVVLAATVYVWVSGFGSQSSTPAKSVALTSAGTITGGIKSYTIASATSGMKYSDISITLDGVAFTQSAVVACGTPAASTWMACTGATTDGAAIVVGAGDTFKLPAAAGQTLRILDTNANSVMLTLVVG